jgi:hypothetical protein
VSLVALCIGLGYAVRLLVPADWNPSVFAAFGALSTEQTAYGKELLGEVVTRPQLGHDGRFFFAQANDPWYLHPAENAAVLDRPLYRAQRMLYPVLAGLFGLLSPTAVLWGMAAVNVIALAFGTLCLSLLAQERGHSPWVGLAFALNFALINELDIGGAGVVATALGILGVLAWERGRLALAVVSVTGAVLSREVMVLFAVGLLICEFRFRHRIWWGVLTVPLLAAGLWHIFILWRLEGVTGDTGIGQAAESLAAPFTGLLQASERWFDNPLDLGLNLAILAIMGVFARRAVRSQDPLAWSAFGFIVLAPFLSAPVWAEPYDISRAVAPVFTAYVVVLLAPPTAFGRASPGGTPDCSSKNGLPTHSRSGRSPIP